MPHSPPNSSRIRAGCVRASARSVLLGFAALLIAVSPVRAADLIVLTAGAFKPVLLGLAVSYLARTGNTLAISNDTAGGVTARVVRGEEIDVVILPAAALDALAAQGKILAGSVVPVAKSGIGVVVKTGAPSPDISSVEAFKQTILDVPSLAYIDPASGGTSGVYLTKLFAQLGITEAIRRKAILVPGGLVASRVDDGEAALGLQQTSELRAVAGVTFVGLLPAPIQNYTIYAAGIPTATRRADAGRTLLTFLRSEAAVPVMAAHGLDSP
jgi:molybdate transport system substrate-binding protein